MSQALTLRPTHFADGLHWMREGLLLLRRQPLALTGCLLMLFLAFMLLVLLPVVGAGLVALLVPAGGAGLMVCIQAVQHGHWPQPALLLAPLRKSRPQQRALLRLGLAAVLAALALAALAQWMDDGELARLAQTHGGHFTPELIKEPGFLEASRRAMHRTVLLGALWLPVQVLLWHAASLVHWHGTPAGRALFFSALALARNAAAYAGWLLGWAGVTLLTSLVLSVLALLPVVGGMATLAALPAGVCLGAAVAASIWSAFVGSFSPAPPSPKLPLFP